MLITDAWVRDIQYSVLPHILDHSVSHFASLEKKKIQIKNKYINNFLTTSTCAFCFPTSGTPINKRPVLGYRNLNLFKLYRLVHKLGGFDNVSATSLALPPRGA